MLHLKCEYILAVKINNILIKLQIYIIKVDRDKQKVPTFVFRRYSEIQELHHKLVVMFPLVRLPSLPGK